MSISNGCNHVQLVTYQIHWPRIPTLATVATTLQLVQAQTRIAYRPHVSNLNLILNLEIPESLIGSPKYEVSPGTVLKSKPRA